MKNSISTDVRSLEKRIADLEDGLKKQTRLTAAIALIAALLGSGGMAGIASMMYQKPLQNVEVHLKQTEEAQKELDLACARRDVTTKSMQQLIDGLEKTGQPEKAKAALKILLQEQADFAAFCAGMTEAMQQLYMVAPGSSRLCEETLREARGKALQRQEELATLLK